MSRAFSHSLSCISLCVRLAYSLGDGQVKAMFETTTDEALQFHDERMEMMKLLGMMPDEVQEHTRIILENDNPRSAMGSSSRHGFSKWGRGA